MDGSLSLGLSILHASPGRIRLGVRMADLNNAALPRAAKVIAALPGVRAVRLNRWARSLVVTSEDGTVGLQEVLAAIEQAGITIVPLAEDHGVPHPGASLDQSITSFFGQIDERVSQHTGGTSLRTLLPIGLAALGVRELVAGRFTAVPWYVLFWYAFDSFLKLRRPEASSDTATGPAAPASDDP